MQKLTLQVVGAQVTLNADNLLSRSGFVIMFAGIPLFWESKLQTEITLSSCESEHVALSTALRFKTFVKEINNAKMQGMEG